MRRRPGAGIFREVATPLVQVAGNHLGATAEQLVRRAPGHLRITLDPGFSLSLVISVNTWSFRNAEAGFDPRVRVGILEERWESLPERGIRECRRFSYDGLPGASGMDFHALERPELEQLLLNRLDEACMIEVWGTPYHRDHPGIHQIHSRNASCAVAESREGCDGALRLYSLRERRMETLLFKFCGQ